MRATETLGIIAQLNKEAVKNAGNLELGRTLNEQASKVIEKTLPKKAQAALLFVPEGVKSMIVSNILFGAVMQFAPTNKKAVYATRKMVDAAMYETLRDIDIPGLIDDFIGEFSDKIELEMLKEGE